MAYFDFATWGRLARLITRERSGGKRKLFLFGVFGGLTAMSAVSALALALDNLLFRGWRRVEPQPPIFIIGNGRSGTTHLHRLLTADQGRFSYFKTYELLMPAVVQKKMFQGIALIDRRCLGGAGARWLQAKEGASLEEVRKLHDWQSTGSEEDDFIMLHNFSALSLIWPFPYPELGYLYDTDRMPEQDRRRIVGWYRDMVKRQLYTNGPMLIHCAKSPQFTLKMRALAETFPGARFVVMMRHPYECIPSLIDLMSWYWRKMGASDAVIETEARQFREKMIEQFRYAVDVADDMPTDRCAMVRFEDLLADPKAVVLDLYHRFGLSVSPAFDEYLEGERQHALSFRSKHEYEGLNDEALRQRIDTELADLFPRFGWLREQDDAAASSQYARQ